MVDEGFGCNPCKSESRRASSGLQAKNGIALDINSDEMKKHCCNVVIKYWSVVTEWAVIKWMEIKWVRIGWE